MSNPEQPPQMESAHDRALSIGPSPIPLMPPVEIAVIHNTHDQSAIHLHHTELVSLISMLWGELAAMRPDLLEEVWWMPKRSAASAVNLALAQPEVVWPVFSRGGRFAGVFASEEAAKRYIADDLEKWCHRNESAYLETVGPVEVRE